MRSPPAHVDKMQVVLWSPIDERHHAASDAQRNPANGFPSPSGLLICRESDASFFLFRSDADWSPFADTWHESCDAARAQAEFEFPEVATTWAGEGRPVADLARAPEPLRLSRLSWVGVWIALLSIAPFALLCLTDGLGLTGPSTGCGLVVVAVGGAATGALLWLAGIFVAPSQRMARSAGGNEERGPQVP